MKHLKTFESIFDVLCNGSSYYKVGLRSPFEYASINKTQKITERVWVLLQFPVLDIAIRKKGHTF